MSLFDPNTVAIVDPVIPTNGVVTSPEDTGKAMAPHDPANSVDSKDDIIDLDKLIDPTDNPSEAIGSENIFNYNQEMSTPAVEDNGEAITASEQVKAFNSFFLGLEHSLAVHETGVNPIITTSDVNPQMAVFPLDDLTVPKTSDDIKDVNGAYIQAGVHQANDIKPFDPEEAIDLVNNIRAISQESLVPIHQEDGVTYNDILQDEQYVDTYTEALIDAEERINDIKTHIAEVGGIDKATAIALENIQPGILSNRVSIESFTSYPTKTNLMISLEATDHWVTGAKVLGGAVIFGLIVKMLLWIREKLSGSINISDKEISAAKNKKDNIVKSINDIARTNVDVIRTDPTIVKRINAKGTALMGSEYKVKITNIAEANNVFLQQICYSEFKNYNKLQVIIVSNKNINSGMGTITKFIGDKLKELETLFIDYESKFRSTNLLDSSKFITNWSEAEGILKTLGFEHKPANKVMIGDYMRNVVTTLAKTRVPTPSYESLSAHGYSPESASGLKDLNSSISKLLSRVTKLANDHTTFPDKNIGDNRNQVGTILKAEVNNLLGIALSAIAIRNSGDALSAKLVAIVNRTDKVWREVFAGTSISYGR